MKHISNFFNRFRKSDDDKIALGILSSIDNDLVISEETKQGGRSNRGLVIHHIQSFTIDDFNIKLTGFNSGAFTLKVDDVSIAADQKILVKMADKLKSVLNKDIKMVTPRDHKKESDDYTRKDALINFHRH